MTRVTYFWLLLRRVFFPVLAGALALIAVAAICAAAPSVQVRLPEAPARFLYDEAGVLSRDERAAIEDSLMVYDRRGIEIGVAIFKTIHDDPIEDVSIALAEKWKPGRADRDNGALVVISLEQRAMRIEVGYGLEGVIPDVVAGRIIRHDMAPAFREGRFGDGIMLAVMNIARAARGEAIPEPKHSELPGWVPLIIILMLIFFMIVVRMASRRAWSSRWRGGATRHGGVWWGGFGSGGGGSFGGGGFSGGSFGGGSFGGGGASGSW